MRDRNIRDFESVESSLNSVRIRARKYAENHAKKYVRWVTRGKWKKFGIGYTRFRKGIRETVSEAELYRRYMGK